MTIYDRPNQLAANYIARAEILALIQTGGFQIGDKPINPDIIYGKHLYEWLRGECDEFALDAIRCDQYLYQSLIASTLMQWVHSGKAVYEIPDDQFDQTPPDHIGIDDVVWPSRCFLLLLPGRRSGDADAMLVLRTEHGEMITIHMGQVLEDYNHPSGRDLTVMYGLTDREKMLQKFTQVYQAIPKPKLLGSNLQGHCQGVHYLHRQILHLMHELSQGGICLPLDGDTSSQGGDNDSIPDDPQPPAKTTAEFDIGILDIVRKRIIELDRVDGVLRQCIRDSKGEVCWHFRRGHKRRRPGSSPDAPKTVKVSPTWVRVDKLDDPTKLPATAGKIR